MAGVQAGPSTATWDCLGDELVSLILEKIAASPSTATLNTKVHVRSGGTWELRKENSLAEYARISGVDTRMRRLCKEPTLFRHIRIEGLLPVGALQWLSTRVNCLETLQLIAVSPAPGCGQPNLRFAERLHYFDVVPIPVQAKHLLATDPGKYMEGIDQVLASAASSLVELEFNEVSGVFSQGILYAVARHCHLLQSLQLAENYFAGAHSALCAVVAGCPSVETFSASEICMYVKDRDSWVNDDTMAVLAWGWKKLRRFSLDRNGITLKGLCHLRHCQKLERLYYAFPHDGFGFDDVGKQGAQVLSSTVKEVDVNMGGTAITPDIRPFMLLCPNVKVVNMTNDEFLDAEANYGVDWKDDLQALQEEYPRVVFKLHGKKFDYDEEVKRANEYSTPRPATD